MNLAPGKLFSWHHKSSIAVYVTAFFVSIARLVNHKTAILLDKQEPANKKRRDTSATVIDDSIVRNVM